MVPTRSTLEAAYASVLENADLAAREHARLGDALQLGVIDPLGQAGTKLDTVRKKVTIMVIHALFSCCRVLTGSLSGAASPLRQGTRRRARQGKR